MTVSNPSVTWPNHTTLVTGVRPEKHGVLYNGLLHRDTLKIEPWVNKEQLIRVPTVYDLAFRAGLTTAHVDWVPTKNSGTFTWEFPEIPNPDGVVEKEMAAAGILSRKEIEEFRPGNIVWRDQFWTAAAIHIITRHKPNLLLVHLLNQDSTHHRYGPRSAAATTAFALADSRVRDILDALTKAGLRDRTTVLIASDHGFKTVRKNIRLDLVFRQQGLEKAAQAVPEGGTALVYLRDPAAAQKVRAALQATEGIDRVFEPAEYAGLGLPTPSANRQMGDLFAAAKDGYSFVPAGEGAPVVDVPESGAHGYLSRDPELDALFLAWGDGIRSGARLDRVRNIDVAPTIAALLGLKMEGVDGTPIRAILK